MIPPIDKSITVPCDQKLAFDTFVEGMGTWWPLGKFTYSAMQGAPAQDIRVDPKPGGEITEIGADGSEVSWGRIETYDPNSYVAMRFHIPAPGYENGGQSLLEIRFTAVADGTRVDLHQSDFEAIGEMGEPSRGGYGQGWDMIFVGAYAEACKTKAT